LSKKKEPEYKAKEYNQDGWSCTRADLLQTIEDAHKEGVDLTKPGEVRPWLQLKFQLLKDGAKKKHIEQIMTLAGAFEKKKSKRKKAAGQASASYQELLDMPDWQPLDGGVMIGMTKMFKGKKKQFTIYVDATGYRVLEKAAFVPPDTQPSHGFDSTPTTEWDEVFEELVKTYKEYIFFTDDNMYSMLACCAMSTYFREVFDTYPYCDFYAAELECGKTTTMKCLIWSSYHGFMPLDPTGPVLFRAIDSCNSAIGIDEVDNLLKNPEAQSRILGLLNASYQKGLVAYRINMEEGGMPVAYDPFGLKSFTHVGAIPESIQSRSIVFALIRSPHKLPVIRTADTFRSQRDKIYKLRLVASEEVEAAYMWTLDFIELANRPKDLFSPPLTMAKLVSDELFNSMYLWARNYVEEHSTQQFDEVKRTLVEVLLGYTGDVKIKVISEELSLKCNDRGLTKSKKDGEIYYFHTRTVIRMLASLGLHKTTKRTDGNVHVRVISSRVRAWARVYKIPIDDSEEDAMGPSALLITKNDEVPSKIVSMSEQSAEESEKEEESHLAPNEEKESALYLESSLTSSSSEQPSRQTETVDKENLTKIDETSPKIETISLDTPSEANEENDVKKTKRIISQEHKEAITSFSPAAFITPVEGQIPDILKKLTGWWKEKDKSYKDGMKPECDADFKLVAKGLESGYLREVMPGSWWHFTDTAKEEIARWTI